MTDAIRLTPGVAAEILAHARAEAPLESCGLLSGPPPAGGPRSYATRYHAARNALASLSAYEIHPEDLVRIVHAIEEAGVELAGIVHSHPRGPAVPSRTDVRESRYAVPHLVVSLLVPRASPIEALRAWEISLDGAREVELSIG